MTLYNRRYFIWGTGRKVKKINQYCNEELSGIQILGYIDNDVKKHGGSFYGKKIYPPEILNKIKDAYIIIISRFRDEILQQIRDFYPYYIDRVTEDCFMQRLQLLNRYHLTNDNELKKCMDYIKCHDLQVFNYPFVEKYEDEKIDVRFDNDKQLFYVEYFGKNMYLSRDYNTVEKSRRYVKSILIEQDELSPHKYLTEDFLVRPGSIVVDAGAAEGCFALPIIDDIKKLYLFEPDPNWVEALNYTFFDYRDKVSIIEKGISNYCNGTTVTLDFELSNEKVDFIKMDIEGEEFEALQGMGDLLSNNNMKCVICAYHQELAYEVIKNYFIKKGYMVENSCGFMYYPEPFSIRRPTLRIGIIRAFRKDMHSFSEVD